MLVKKVQVNENQISFFDMVNDEALKRPVVAISMFDEQEYVIYPIEPWMAKILSQGEYYMLCAGHPLVLCVSDEKIVPEMRYRHFKIGDKVYAATGVGRGEDMVEDDSSCIDACSCEDV